MAVIGNTDVYNILRTSFSIMNKPLMNHGERTAYIFYKMLQCEGKYNQAELADYIMLAVLHDIGTCKPEYKLRWKEFEKRDVWPHSIFGFLFFKYLSPLEDKAEIILYHHLHYNKFDKIKSKYAKLAQYLFLADTMDVIMCMPDVHEPDYFKRYRDITFSGEALELFFKAEAKYDILNKLKTREYISELDAAIGSAKFSEEYKRKFLQMLVFFIDFRSEHTVVHTLATTTFALEIAKLMRVSNQDKYNLYYGAMLHDLGKIAIPISILEAPRKLNDKEMEIMKAHVVITDKILNGIVDDEVRLISVRHHEKMDGSGYPNGISGAQLTLPQKIVAVADIISALYGKRSYKEAFDTDRIVKILKSDADNNKLSKEVVDVAVRNINRIIDNFEEQKDSIMGTYMQIKRQEKDIYQQFAGL